MKKRILIAVALYVILDLAIVVPTKIFKLHQLRHTKGKIVSFASYGVTSGYLSTTASAPYPIIKIKLDKDSFFIEKEALSGALFYDPYDFNQEYDVYYKLNRIVKHYYFDSAGYKICLEANYPEEKCREMIYTNTLNIQKEEHFEVDNDSAIINKFFWYWLPMNEIILHFFFLFIFLIGVYILTEKESDGS